jgi:hypothetical protein
MAAEPGKWGRSKFNYPTETAVNDIHETTVQPGDDVTAVTASILPAELSSSRKNRNFNVAFIGFVLSVGSP